MGKCLLVDAGNTQVKCCVYDDSTALPEGRWGVIDSSPTQHLLHKSGLKEWGQSLQRLAAEQSIDEVRVCQVLGAEWSESVQRVLKPLRVTLTVVGESRVLSTLYDEPQKLGQDRWLGALAAANESSSSLNLIASFGTATTLDAVVDARLVDEEFETPWVHLGGLIAPGVGTMLQSLNQSTQQLPMAELAVQPWPRSTHKAIGFGVLLAQQQLLVNRCEVLRAEFPGQPLTVWACGGHASQIVEGLSGIGRD